MKYCVNIPLGEPLAFPQICPFSGDPFSSGTVRLKQTKTLMVLPLPGGIYNSYSTTTLRVPASGRIAKLALGLEIMIWISLLGGIGICVLLLTQSPGTHERTALLSLLASPFLALGFRFWRFMILRPVRIKPAQDGYTEMQFQSESYARQFSELNRLQMFAD
jgi:hypothetical protein